MCGSVSSEFGRKRIDNGTAMPWARRFDKVFIEITDTEGFFISDETEILYQDLFDSGIFRCSQPYSHYYKQRVRLNIMIDTGDGARDYTDNSVYPHWDAAPGIEISSNASILWLAESQGISKTELLKSLTAYTDGLDKTGFLETLAQELINMPSHMSILTCLVETSLEANAPKVAVLARQMYMDEPPTKEQQMLASSIREVFADIRGTTNADGDDAEMPDPALDELFAETNSTFAEEVQNGEYTRMGETAAEDEVLEVKEPPKVDEIAPGETLAEAVAAALAAGAAVAAGSAVEAAADGAAVAGVLLL